MSKKTTSSSEPAATTSGSHSGDGSTLKPPGGWWSFVREFAHMTRSTAVTLIVFIAVVLLYFAVRDDPLVRINPSTPAPSGPESSQVVEPTPTTATVETSSPVVSTAQSSNPELTTSTPVSTQNQVDDSDSDGVAPAGQSDPGQQGAQSPDGGNAANNGTAGEGTGQQDSSIP